MGEMANSQALNSSLCFSSPSLLCAAVLVPSLGYICFLSFEFFPFLLTISILILSTILLLTNTKKKVILNEKPVGIPLCGKNNLPDEDEVKVREQLVQEVENDKEVCEELHSAVETEKEVVESITKTAQQSENGTIYEYQVEHLGVPSDSKFSDESSVPSEHFELNWMCSSNVSEEVEVSYGFSASDDDDDDDSLIEINLPGSELVGEPKEKLLSKFPDFLPDSIFRQQGLRELLADINEMNEEENLIEIDISMG